MIQFEGDNNSLVKKVEMNLVNLLQQRQLKVGDTIPKEIELAELLGVSRTVIREVLVHLRAFGLIETRRKRGTIITSPNIFDTLSKSLNSYLLDNATLKDMFELRLIIEIGMADFIFDRVTPEDIDQLRMIIAKEPEVTGNKVFDINHEIAFHGKLYEICGNETTKKFHNILLPIFDHVHSNKLFYSEKKSSKFVSHRGIVDVIAYGSPELLRNAMRNHLSWHFDCMTSRNN